MSVCLPLWRDENRDIFQATVVRAAQDLDIPALAVEKDYWVCEALRAIEAAHPRVTVFKGGTSLQKMGIIARFSEDLDLVVTGPIGGGKAGPRYLKDLCEAAREATGGALFGGQHSGKPAAEHRPASASSPGFEGREGTLGYRVNLSIPVVAKPAPGLAVADPSSILLELGQSTGHDPNEEREVMSLLARQLGPVVDIRSFADLAPFRVRMLDPGRTLLEKLLRVNTFACMPPADRKEHLWTRIGRQYYDIWALLDQQDVRAFFARPDLGAVIADCFTQSVRFGGDRPIPIGGFAMSPAFDPNADVTVRLRKEHAKAMRVLYYGPDEGPTFDDVLNKVSSHRAFLDFASHEDGRLLTTSSRDGIRPGTLRQRGSAYRSK